jgi:hypothetical protein
MGDMVSSAMVDNRAQILNQINKGADAGCIASSIPDVRPLAAEVQPKNPNQINRPLVRNH